MFLSRDFLETISASSLAAGLFLVGMLVPELGLLAGFFSPASIIWLTYCRGWSVGLFGLLLSASLILPFISLTAALSFMLEHALLGWSLGFWLSRGKGVISSNLRSTILVIAASLTAFLAVFLFSGLGPDDIIKYQLSETLNEIQASLEDLSRHSAPAAAVELRPLLDFLARSFPALVFIGLFLECSANSLLVLRILSRSPSRPGISFPSLTVFSLPERLIWVLIPALATLWWPQPAVRVAALNLTLTLLFFYLLQGLSIAAHFSKRANLSRLVLLILGAVVILQPYFLALPLLAGLLDFRFNFRNRWPIQPPSPS